MNSKNLLHGAGVYYFALSGAKQQPIFHSVFEYQYGVNILANLPNTDLLAYVFTEDRLFCVLRCQDSADSLHNIQTAFDEMHQACWRKRRQVLSEQAHMLLIDEQAYLVDLILQLHDWPRYSGLVADGSLWQWSSDQHYRSPKPPAWLDVEPMLNLLAHSRRNRDMHYRNVMSNPIGNKHDLVEGNHSEVFALARPEFVERFDSTQISAHFQPVVNSLELFDNACALVATHFNITPADLKDDRNRRRFHHLMPLVVWLMRKSNAPFDDIAKLTNEDEVRLELWLRNLEADHTDNTRQKLAKQWL